MHEPFFFIGGTEIHLDSRLDLFDQGKAMGFRLEKVAILAPNSCGGLPHDGDMSNLARHATKERAGAASYGAFNGPAAGNRTEMRISIRHDTNGVEWHNIVFERCQGAAQVLDYTS